MIKNTIRYFHQDSNLFAIESQEEESWLTDVFTNHVDTEWWTSGVYNGTKWIWQDGLTGRGMITHI